MSISAISSTTGNYMQGTASDGDSAAVEAKESAATKLSEQLNGGKSSSTSGGTQSSSNNNLVKIKMYANQHMPAAEIAQRLGMSVATVVQEASAAGVNLNSANSPATTNTNAAVGNYVDTMA